MSKKKSFSLEYDFHASRQMLFQYLSTPSGLGEWFADNVNSRGEYFNFIWEDAEETAKLIQKKNNERVRFHGKMMKKKEINIILNLKFKSTT